MRPRWGDVYSLESRRLKRDIIAANKYHQGNHISKGRKFIEGRRARSNGLELTKEKFRLQRRRNVLAELDDEASSQEKRVHTSAADIHGNTGQERGRQEALVSMTALNESNSDTL